MLSRLRTHLKDLKLARMSSGTYCIIRDLGLVKGGKGMKHHEVVVTFSLRALLKRIRRPKRSDFAELGGAMDTMSRKAAGASTLRKESAASL
jgi:hypothetical protein